MCNNLGMDNITRPTVKTVTRYAAYMGSRANVTTVHHDSNRVGLRTITFEWIDKAHEGNGGWPAGAVTRKVVKGDGRYTAGTKAFQIIEAEERIA